MNYFEITEIYFDSLFRNLIDINVRQLKMKICFKI